MKTSTYTASIDLRPDSLSSSGSGGHPDIASAVADAICMATYYRSIGYRNIHLEIQEGCAECFGSGTVPGARRRKRCPNCKGAPEPAVIRIPFTVPQSVDFVHNGMTDDAVAPVTA